MDNGKGKQMNKHAYFVVREETGLEAWVPDHGQEPPADTVRRELVTAREMPDADSDGVYGTQP